MALTRTRTPVPGSPTQRSNHLIYLLTQRGLDKGEEEKWLTWCVIDSHITLIVITVTVIYSAAPLVSSILATSKVISGWYQVMTVHIHGDFVVLPHLEDQTTSTMTRYTRQSHYPDTKQTIFLSYPNISNNTECLARKLYVLILKVIGLTRLGIKFICEARALPIQPLRPSAAPLQKRTTSTMTRYPTQSHYPYSDPMRLCLMLITPSTRQCRGKRQFLKAGASSKTG